MLLDSFLILFIVASSVLILDGIRIKNNIKLISGIFILFLVLSSIVILL